MKVLKIFFLIFLSVLISSCSSSIIEKTNTENLKTELLSSEQKSFLLNSNNLFINELGNFSLQDITLTFSDERYNLLYKLDYIEAKSNNKVSLYLISSKENIDINKEFDSERGILYTENVSISPIPITFNYFIIEGFNDTFIEYFEDRITLELFNSYFNSENPNFKLIRNYNHEINEDLIRPIIIQGNRVGIENTNGNKYYNLSLKVYKKNGELCGQLDNICIENKGSNSLYVDNCYTKIFEEFDIYISDSENNTVHRKLFAKEDMGTWLKNDSKVLCEYNNIKNIELKSEKDFIIIHRIALEGVSISNKKEKLYENVSIKILNNNKEEICDTIENVNIYHGSMGFEINNCEFTNDLKYFVNISGPWEEDLIKEISSYGLLEQQLEKQERIENEKNINDSYLRNRKIITNFNESYIENEPNMGTSDAPVIVIKFGDYEDPFSSKWYKESFDKLKQEYIDTGKVKFVYKDYPLSFHKHSKSAAILANCIYEKLGKDEYFQFYSILSENYDHFTDKNLKTWSLKVGLEDSDYDLCFSKVIMDEIEEDYKGGHIRGISNTPSFFINNESIVGAQPYSVIKEVIEQKLE